MFCSECGCPARGKFCSHCGFKLVPSDAAGEDDGHSAVAVDWSDLLDYKQLIAIGEVRDLIAASAARSKKGMSGEEWLDLYGKAMGKMTGVPLPMSGLAHFAQSMNAKLGIRTGKSRSELFPQPPGRILVALLCSLAEYGREVRSAHQQTDGVIVVSALPSDLFALEGDLVVRVSRASAGTQVEATTEIPGAVYDWGKSKRALAGLFEELKRAA